MLKECHMLHFFQDWVCFSSALWDICYSGASPFQPCCNDSSEWGTKTMDYPISSSFLKNNCQQLHYYSISKKLFCLPAHRKQILNSIYGTEFYDMTYVIFTPKTKYFQKAKTVLYILIVSCPESLCRIRRVAYKFNK